MRRIAIINQKGGVGKTTTTVNLGAALAIQGRRVVVVDMDAQANLSMALGIEAPPGSPTSYSILMGDKGFGECLLPTKIQNLSLVASNIDLSGAELELASAMGREFLLRDALGEWNDAHVAKHGRAACDYVLFDCPPSLGLLSINALAAAGEVLITLQTEFLALQGMSKLFEIVTLLKKRLNPTLHVTGIVPSLYDSRLKLAREVLGEIRTYFKGQVVPHPIRANVKLAEAPSFGQTIFEYAPDSNGADDYMKLAAELLASEGRDADLARLPAFDPAARLPVELTNQPPATKRVPPPPRRKATTVVPAASAQKPAVPPKPPQSADHKPAPIAVVPASTVTNGTAKAPSLKTVAVVPPAPTTESKAKKARESAPTPIHESPPAAAPARSRANKSVKPPAQEKSPAAPAPKVPPAPVSRVRAPTKASHVVRTEDLPPLPPDAFEILSMPIDP